MKKRGQTSSFDFILGIVIFISVLSFFLFYLAPKGFTGDQIPYSVLQAAWFDLEQEDFFDDYLINESLFADLSYDDINKIFSESTVFSSSAFCLYTVAEGGTVYHFGPDSPTLEIFKGVNCGSAAKVTKVSPVCRGEFNAGRSISKFGYSVKSKKFVKINLLVCGEIQ